MAGVLGRSPYGVAYQQDDGSVLTLPPELLPDSLPPPAPATPAPAFEQAPADQNVSPVPDIARDAVAADLRSGAIAPPTPAGPRLAADPNAIEMEGEDISVPGGRLGIADGVLPDELPPASGIVNPFSEPAEIQMEGDPAPLGVPDAVTGADPAIAGSLSPAPIEPGEDAGSDAGELSPLAAQEDAIRAQGVLAKQRADEEARLLRERDAKLAPIEAMRAEADRIAVEHEQQAAEQVNVARQKFIDYDMTPEEKTSALGVIGLIFGGIGNVLTGNFNGVNPVIGILERKADKAARDRQAQQGKLGQEVDMARGNLDNMRMLTKSVAAQHEGIKSAMLESYARQIETKGAEFAGPVAQQQAEQAVAQLRAAAAAAAAKAAIEMTKEQREDAALALKAQEVIDNRLHQQRADKADLQRTYTGARAQLAQVDQFKETHSDAEDQREIENQRGLIDLAARVHKAYREGDTAQVAQLSHEYKVKSEERERQMPFIKSAKVVANPDGTQAVVSEDVPMKQADGTEYLAPTTKEAQELREAYENVDKMTQMIDLLDAAISKNGFQSATIKSPEYRKAVQLHAELLLIKKERDKLGVLSGGDQKIENLTIGTDDPTELRSGGVEALRSLRQITVDALNAKLRAKRYTGEKVDFPNTQTQPGGALSPAQQDVKAATSTDRSKDNPEWALKYRGTEFAAGDRTPLTGPEADATVRLIARAKSKNAAQARDAKAGLVALTKRKDIAQGVIRQLVGSGLDLSDVDGGDKVMERMRADETWDDVTGGAVKDEANRDLGISGLVKRAGQIRK